MERYGKNNPWRPYPRDGSRCKGTGKGIKHRLHGEGTPGDDGSKLMESYTELQGTLADTREQLALTEDRLQDETKLRRIKAGMLESAEYEVDSLREQLEQYNGK